MTKLVSIKRSADSKGVAFVMAWVVLLTTALPARLTAASEYVWRPKARTIYGLINVNRSLEESQYRRKIGEQRELVTARQKELSELIPELRQQVKTLSGTTEPAPVQLDNGALTDPGSEMGERTEAADRELALAQSELETTREILRRLEDLELILTSDSFTRLYQEFLLELEKREAPQKGDALLHLNLFVAYAKYLEGESFHHKALRTADHRLEFQKFVSGLFAQKHELVAFLADDFAHSIFESSIQPKARALPILKLDLSMSKAGAITAAVCGAAILVAGYAYQYTRDPAPQRATEISQPFIQNEMRGREKQNLPDGDIAAEKALEKAAERAAQGLRVTPLP